MAKRNKKHKRQVADSQAEAMFPVEQPEDPSNLSGGETKVSLSFELLQAGYTISKCSHCLDELSDKLRMVTSLTWTQLYATGRKSGKKPGLNYEQNVTVNFPIPKNVPKDKLCSFRITQTARSVGFRIKNSFYIVWLDPFHKYTD